MSAAPDRTAPPEPQASGSAPPREGWFDRPMRWAQLTLAETDLIMAVDGYPTLKDLTPDVLRRVT